MTPFNPQNVPILLRSPNFGDHPVILEGETSGDRPVEGLWSAWTFAWRNYQAREPRFLRRFKFLVRTLWLAPWSLKWYQELARVPEATLNPQPREFLSRLCQVHRPYYDVRLNVRERLLLLVSNRRCLNARFQRSVLRRLERGEHLLLATLNGKAAGYQVVLSFGQSPREGSMMLTLQNERGLIVRASLTLSQDVNGMSLLIGCVQSIDDQPKEQLKQVTKDLEGIQPRLLLVQAIRLFAHQIGVARLEGVATKHHPYSSGRYHRRRLLKVRFEPLWELVGGCVNLQGNFDLPLHKSAKSIAEVASSKRAQWRRQQVIYAALQSAVSATMFGLQQGSYK